MNTILGDSLLSVEGRQEWWDWMKKIGIAADGDSVRRVVIDVAVDAPVRIYIEKTGQEGMISVAPPTIGITE